MFQKETIPNVNDCMLYNHMQVYFIELYLDLCRKNGDVREKNEIVAEWIKTNSAKFRDKWCEYQKVI